MFATRAPKFRPLMETLEDRLLLTVIGTDDRILVSPTTGYPFRAVGHLITIWPNGTSTVGSGAMVDATHFLTAAHCVYSASRGGWASTQEVVLGQDGNYKPYGSVYATYQRTFTGYTSTANSNHDMALLTLGSAIGNSTGWFGMQVRSDSWFNSHPTINSAGYPADIGGNTHMYRISGPIQSASTYRLSYNGTMDTYGGQSGSPLWRYVASTGERHIIGVHTTGGTTSNGGTRMNQAKFDAIVGWMRTDNTVRRSAFAAGTHLMHEAASLADGMSRNFAAADLKGVMESAAVQMEAAPPVFQAQVGFESAGLSAQLESSSSSKQSAAELAFQADFFAEVKPSSENASVCLPTLKASDPMAAEMVFADASPVSSYRAIELSDSMLS